MIYMLFYNMVKECINSNCSYMVEMSNGNCVCKTDGIPTDLFIVRGKCWEDMKSYERKKLKKIFYANEGYVEKFFRGLI